MYGRYIPHFWFMLMFQLPVPGSCCILKLSRDIPKLPRIEFPNSFSFPKASSLSLDIFSSYSICSFRLKYMMTVVKWKCACYSSVRTRALTSFHLSSDRRDHYPVPIWHLQQTFKHVREIKGSKDIVPPPWCVPVSASSYFSSFSYESIRLASTLT